MKVVHVITSLGQGGAETMLEKLLLAARDADPEITQQVISLRDMGDVGARLSRVGIIVTALGMNGPLKTVRGFWRLVRILRNAGSESVIQTWMYHADLIGGIACAFAARRRLVWNIRQTGVTLRDIGRTTRFVVRLCAALSRYLPKKIVMNAQAAVVVHAALGYDEKRFVIIPNGFDLSVFSRKELSRAAVRAVWGMSREELAIGMVARVDPQKDHHNFIKAAGIVAARMPKVKFVLVGRGVETDAQIRKWISEARIAGRFVLQGQRMDIPAVMSALDLFCLSSRAEGFPNVLGEAMACETPSVSTDAGDARMLVGEEYVVPIEDSVALATRMIQICALSAEERAELGRRQSATIAKHFDIVNVWHRYYHLYQQL